MVKYQYYELRKVLYMEEIILLKQGEMVLKGLNRRNFENRMVSNIAYRLRRFGSFKVYSLQSTVYIEPQSEVCDLDGAYEAASKVFGAVSITRAAACDKDLEALYRTAKSYLRADLERAATFKVESKRADKAFPLTSIQLSQEVGGRLQDDFPHLKVDLHRPELTVFLEVRDHRAYVHAQAAPAAGGMPLGTNGRGMLLLSGGIDSPVAGYMMAKRGVELEAVHFFSYPYTSQRAKRKVLELAGLMGDYTGRLRVHVAPFTHIQEEIRDKCPEALFTVLMRRFMMRIAQGTALKNDCKCLITGESLGQVASQTMEAMGVTGSVCTLPVFRPCVGMDKEEIVRLARKIGTFETSIQPYEDCCTVFTPRHPKTKPTPEEAALAEEKLDVAALVEESLAGVEIMEGIR